MADITKINLKGTLLTIKDQYAYHNGDLATVATSGSYNDLEDKPDIPEDLGDLTNNAGYTKNTGTITGITMNGTSKGTSGVVNLGTVITAHQDISGKANKSDLATVATSGSYNDLSNKPTIPDTSTLATKTELNAKQDKINDLADIRINSGKGVADMSSNADGTVVTTLANGDTYTLDLNHEHPQYVESDDLADVATSGSYNDLQDKPTIPDVSGFATTSAMNTALAGKQNTLTFDTTPTANSTNPVTSGGVKTYIDGKATITGITTSQDGSFTISLSDGNSYTVYLNHVHPQYLDVDDIDEYITAGTNVTISKDSQTGVLEISATGGGSGSQVQANWNESDSTSAAYIQNKPTIPTVPTNVSSFTNDANYLKFQLLADEAAYTALATKDSGTLYLIPES